MAKTPPLTLATPIQYAKGVGDARAAELIGLGIHTCGGLLFHLPRDYLHYTDEAPISALKAGDMATVRGILLQTRLIPKRPRRFEALLQDEASTGADGGRCVLTWFNPYGLDKKLLPGMQVRVTGKVTVFRNRFQIAQPKYEILDGKGGEAAAPKSARIEPVYPATMELPSPQIAKLVAGVLDALIPQIPEYFPPAFLAERNLFTRQEALRRIHHPQTLKESIVAKRTLAYHEFFLHQAAVAIKRFHQRNAAPAIPLRVDEAVDARIRALLPFALTTAQNRVIESIRRDLAGTKPMNRLLQGDVGSGKTVVALYAMLAATATVRGDEARATGEERKTTAPPNHASPGTPSASGHQAALMAPTEILAEQHYITLTRLLEGKKVRFALLTGSVQGAERQRVLAGLADGSIGLVVGTHALLSEAVQFKSLALVVVDEQHKFGVEQRSLIRRKPAGGGGGSAPHTLVMTATPIPRTLAMTAFGDLDVSVIDELPPGRQPIFTKMTPSGSRDDVYEWLAKKLAAKEQAYIVVPTIEEAPAIVVPAPAEGGAGPLMDAGDGIEDPPAGAEAGGGAGPNGPPLRAAVAVHRELQGGPLAAFRVGLIHGRMAQDVRQHIMERFRQGLIDALVATTVIEVGVDVPNASVMVIENADRFGLSQLHQLRGRVGRGTKQSYCILIGDLATDDAVKRLQAMVKHSSGFKIAEEDLRLRGMGHLIGTAQSGRTDLHFAELLFDPVLLPLSRRDAFQLIAHDPRLLDPGHAELRTAILTRFADSISLADVG
jgi:ATP-dependent DNA helicase RecG